MTLHHDKGRHNECKVFLFFGEKHFPKLFNSGVQIAI